MSLVLKAVQEFLVPEVVQKAELKINLKILVDCRIGGISES